MKGAQKIILAIALAIGAAKGHSSMETMEREGYFRRTLSLKEKAEKVTAFRHFLESGVDNSLRRRLLDKIREGEKGTDRLVALDILWKFFFGLSLDTRVQENREDHGAVIRCLEEISWILSGKGVELRHVPEKEAFDKKFLEACCNDFLDKAQKQEVRREENNLMREFLANEGYTRSLREGVNFFYAIAQRDTVERKRVRWDDREEVQKKFFDAEKRLEENVCVIKKVLPETVDPHMTEILENEWKEKNPGSEMPRFPLLEAESFNLFQDVLDDWSLHLENVYKKYPAIFSFESIFYPIAHPREHMEFSQLRQRFSEQIYGIAKRFDVPHKIMQIALHNKPGSVIDDRHDHYVTLRRNILENRVGFLVSIKDHIDRVSKKSNPFQVTVFPNTTEAVSEDLETKQPFTYVTENDVREHFFSEWREKVTAYRKKIDLNCRSATFLCELYQKMREEMGKMSTWIDSQIKNTYSFVRKDMVLPYDSGIFSILDKERKNILDSLVLIKKEESEFKKDQKRLNRVYCEFEFLLKKLDKKQYVQ